MWKKKIGGQCNSSNGCFELLSRVDKLSELLCTCCIANYKELLKLKKLEFLHIVF
jgi:hypothetical protein